MSTSQVGQLQIVRLLKGKTRAVFWSVTVAVVLTGLAFLELVYSDYQAVQANAIAQPRDILIAELRGTIVHLDEVLTMSARMAASTGDLSWEKRYRFYEPTLDAAIKEAIRLAPSHTADHAAETDVANAKLVAMENHAFDLVRAGRLDTARAVLFSTEYEEQKRIYARGMGTLAAQLQRVANANLGAMEQGTRRRVWGALLLIVLWSGGWVMILRIMNHAQQAILHTSIQQTQHADTLAGLNEDLGRQVTRLAFYDTLTGLPNRNQLYDRLLATVQTASEDGTSMGLLLMDLDHFKEINSGLGHHRGDVLLNEVGTRIKRAMFEPDMVARLGGDEFAVLLPKLSKADDILVVLRKVQQALQDPFLIDDLPIHVEASIGAALYPEHGRTPDSLLQQADVAMYEAKRSRSGYLLYSPTLNQYNPKRLALMAELRETLERHQLILHYQPKISLRTGTTVGVEALVRWRHPQRGMIPPDQFIGPAEQTGLIHPLTHQILEMGIRQCGALQRGLTVSANLSPRNLLDQKLPRTVAELLDTNGVSPRCLCLEITENAIMTDPTRAQGVLAKLHAIGVKLSIDDFGVGYSSLSYLRKLPVDQIKVDKSFVLHMTQNEGDAKIVRATIDLAHNLGLEVVAEGVETKEILDRLTEMGCDAAQGYFMSKPLPAEDLIRWVKESPWGMKNGAEDVQDDAA